MRDRSCRRWFYDCLSATLWLSSRTMQIYIETWFIKKYTILHISMPFCTHSSMNLARASRILLLFLAAEWRITILLLMLHSSFVNSPVLYNLVLEPFLHSVFQNNNFSGYTVEVKDSLLLNAEIPRSVTTNILCYVDDTLVLLSNLQDIQ